MTGEADMEAKNAEFEIRQRSRSLGKDRGQLRYNELSRDQSQKSEDRTTVKNEGAAAGRYSPQRNLTIAL